MRSLTAKRTYCRQYGSYPAVGRPSVGALAVASAADVIESETAEQPAVRLSPEIEDSEDLGSEHLAWVQSLDDEVENDPRPPVPWEKVKAEMRKKIADAIRKEQEHDRQA